MLLCSPLLPPRQVCLTLLLGCCRALGTVVLLQVNHSMLAGVTTDMLVWWFSEGVLGRSVQAACAGSQNDGLNQSYPNYLCALSSL